MMLKVFLSATLVAGFFDVSNAHSVRSGIRAADDKDGVPMPPVIYTFISGDNPAVPLTFSLLGRTLTGVKDLKMNENWKSIMADDEHAISTATFTAPKLASKFNATTHMYGFLLAANETSAIYLQENKVLAVVNATKKGSECEFEVKVFVKINDLTLQVDRSIFTQMIEIVLKGLTEKFNEALPLITTPLFAANIRKMIESNQDWKNTLCPWN